MKYFGYWTLLIALAVSAVAAYYSVVGLTAIFAAAVIPIIIMGTALEIAKVTTAIWLHSFWSVAPTAMRIYLTSATVVLMFITSMGIFGFLSKAHIEQTAQAGEGRAQIERIETELQRLDNDIARAEESIDKIENATTNADGALQEKIATEESRIASIYTRLDVDLANAQTRHEQKIAPYEQMRQQIDDDLSMITQYLSESKIRSVQALIGVKPDGSYGENTAAAVAEFRAAHEQRRNDALSAIDEARDELTAELAQLREQADASIAQSNTLINRLRDQIGITTAADESDVDRISTLRQRIKDAELSKDELISTRYEIEVENRKLEAEVGPVKYIAEMIYGEDAGNDLLEKAVRYVILMIVAVFDPLAIVLVLAGVMTIERFHGPRIEKYTHDEEEPTDDNHHTSPEFPAVHEFLRSQDTNGSMEGSQDDIVGTPDVHSTSSVDVYADSSEIIRSSSQEEIYAAEEDIVKDEPVPDAGETGSLSPGRLYRR